MLRTGFIGFGRMGITHFSILNTHPSVEIVAVCDQSKTMINIVGKYLNAKSYTDYQKMLDETELDCVIISTPSDSHAEVLKAAIERNFHIFVEKPLTLSVKESLDILAHLERKHLVNQVGYVNRFNEVFMEVKTLLHKGIIGEVKNFSSEMYGATVLKDSKSSWRGRRETGGGCLYEFASHCIDLIIYLLDKPDKVIGSVLESVYSSGVEDLVISNFVYDNGCSGSIIANWSDETYRKPTNVVKILGTKGKIIADKHAYKIYLKDGDPENGFKKGWNTHYITDFAKSVRFYLRGNEFTRQLDYFIECVEKKKTDNISSFAEGFKTDWVIEEISKGANSSFSNKGITLEKSHTTKKSIKRRSLWGKLV